MSWTARADVAPQLATAPTQQKRRVSPPLIAVF